MKKRRRRRKKKNEEVKCDQQKLVETGFAVQDR
jgi:hypothetical protein